MALDTLHEHGLALLMMAPSLFTVPKNEELAFLSWFSIPVTQYQIQTA